MTEEEWLSARDPTSMLEFIRDSTHVRTKLKKSRKRLLRLFGCGCCRNLISPKSDKCISFGVQVAERVADGEKCTRDREAAFKRFRRFHSRLPAGINPNDLVEGNFGFALGFLLEHDRYFDEAIVESCVSSVVKSIELANPSRRIPELQYQAALMRDIFGNPFRPVTVDGRWLSSTVLDLARTIYDERVFERLPILADALMDAGCDNEEILDHCRSEGPHVRGCWAVDLLLVKK